MPKPRHPIANLFPDLSPEKQAEAEEVLRRYFAFIAVLHLRVTSDQEERERFHALTEELRIRRMEGGRTFTNQNTNTDV